MEQEIAWKPQLPHSLRGCWINKPASQERLYAQLCCIAYLLDAIEPCSLFKQKLKSLLSAYPMADIRAMGFPPDWQEEPLWR